MCFLIAKTMELSPLPESYHTRNRASLKESISQLNLNESSFLKLQTSTSKPITISIQKGSPKGRAAKSSHLPSPSLTCDTCSKSYKHAPCLQKHQWTHSEGWIHTSKLRLSKHEQVKMLETATILLAISNEHDDVDIFGNSWVL